MIKILFVCLGNICRSPMAEAIFKDKIEKKGLGNHFQADSAGTSDYHIGELPDERTIRCLKSKGIETRHRGRQINRLDFKEFDYIIAMDDQNLQNLTRLKAIFGCSDRELFLMRDFVAGDTGQPVPDPYYGGEKEFEEIYTVLDRSIEHFLAKILEKYPVHEPKK